MPRMDVTLVTSHPLMSALNALAWSNMKFIVVTRDVSHKLMSALKFALSLKISLMSVIVDVSHVPISPYCVRACASFETQRLTAVTSAALLVMAAPAGGGGVGEGGG